MKQLLFAALCVMTISCFGQEGDRAVPEVSTLTLGDGEVTTVHLCAGYTTSLRLPEEVSSIVIGDPVRFKAEHSAAEPRLVFLKPLTSQRGQSNALITTKSGQEINLHLVSGCSGSKSPTIDFFVDYKRPLSPIISPSDSPSFLVGAGGQNAESSGRHSFPDDVLAHQRRIASPEWHGTDLQMAIGESVSSEDQLIVGFSILNNSAKAIELLAPEIQLGAREGKKKKQQVKADPVAISDYRFTAQRLEPGQRADGVVVFERPTFKENKEKLLLAVAKADSVDQPVVLPLPFTGKIQGGAE